jgi:hypothetical protein
MTKHSILVEAIIPLEVGSIVELAENEGDRKAMGKGRILREATQDEYIKAMATDDPEFEFRIEYLEDRLGEHFWYEIEILDV